MWEVWHFEASNSALRACNAHCHLHGGFAQSRGVRDLPGPISLQANANSRLNLAHLKVPSEWAWLELLGEKRQSFIHHTSTVRDTKCSHDIFAWPISKAELILNSHFARVRPPSAILRSRAQPAQVVTIIYTERSGTERNGMERN